MTKAFTCDRCGGFYENSRIPALQIEGMTTEIKFTQKRAKVEEPNENSFVVFFSFPSTTDSTEEPTSVNLASDNLSK